MTKESCICIGEQKHSAVLGGSGACYSVSEVQLLQPMLIIAEKQECIELYTNKVWGIFIQKILDTAHIMSAVAVSFARGLNDTPKIAGLLVAVKSFDINYGMMAIAIGMAIGGLLNARRVAETMSNKITEINHGQGLSANLVTSFLVIIASKFGVPVSTTHVSVGAIFGIGLISKKSNFNVICSIILSWLITLPIAMMFSSLTYLVISQINI
jgi:PiT family inorganic phosphate transporter